MTAEATSWAPVDVPGLIDVVSAGHRVGPEPTLLRRTDGPALLYPGELHLVMGEPEAGKGWLACAGIAERLAAGERVLYIDFETDVEAVLARMLTLGVDADVLAQRFAYVRPWGPLTGRAWIDLEPALTAHPTLVVLDGVTEAFGLEGLDPDRNRDAAAWITRVPRRILAATGAAVLMVDHVTKSREGRGRWAIGAQHKLAAVAAAYALDVIERPARDRPGVAKIAIAKDRHGAVRAHAHDGHIALMRIEPTSDGNVTVTLDPPPATANDNAPTFRPTFLMERVSRALEAEPGLTKRALRAAVKGRNDVIDLALELLIAEGHIDARRDGTAHHHHSTRPYRQDDDSAAVPNRAPTVPNRALGTPETSVPTCPSPEGGTARGTTPTGHQPCPATDDEARLADATRKLQEGNEG